MLTDKEKKRAYDAQRRLDSRVKERRKETNDMWYKQNKGKVAQKHQENKEKNNAYDAQWRRNNTENALYILNKQELDEQYMRHWHLYCNRIRKSAKANGNPYSDDFTDVMMFEMMKQGCIYCGDQATTIDRIISSETHTPDNCVGCCLPCNISKGNGDVDSFIRKAYYRVRGEYLDDDVEIWSDNREKPRRRNATKRSAKKGIEITLTHREWDELTKGDCVYCKRARSDDKWNGVDRVVSTEGYTPDNTVSCCNDCNIDKLDLSVEETMVRNEKIAIRVETGQVILTGSRKVLRNTGVK